MSYVIGTTGTKVQWYRFSRSSDGREKTSFDVLDKLDLSQVTVFENRLEAKRQFVRCGLRTCRYFKF